MWEKFGATYIFIHIKTHKNSRHLLRQSVVLWTIYVITISIFIQIPTVQSSLAEAMYGKIKNIHS